MATLSKNTNIEIVKKTEATLKRNSHVAPNRCLDLCCKHSTNHLSLINHCDQQLPLFATSPFLVVNFPPKY